MHAGYKEEGDKCGDNGCGGTLAYSPVEGCCCHICPPCNACVSNPLRCEVCGWTDEHEPPERYIMAAPGLAMSVTKPRKLDKTKIDYIKKPHSNSSMLVEGVYPPDVTNDDVRRAVDGTFGGRFEQFGGGKFRFIAYTD